MHATDLNAALTAALFAAFFSAGIVFDDTTHVVFHTVHLTLFIKSYAV